MSKLEGRCAIVTGAGRGIGKAIAARLLADGARTVGIMEYNGQLAREAAEELDEEIGVAAPIPCDITDRNAVEAAIASFAERFGRIDILVNNAGITRDHIFHKMDYEAWDKVLATNLGGIFNTCHAVWPIMRAQEYGRIVNISSTSAYGNAGQANYAAAKAGILGFTATLAKEGARKGIVVNAVTPGTIDTEMYAAVPEEARQRTIRAIPMQRLGKPEEIAGVVSFLCGPDVSYMTGQVISVSGGLRTY